MNCKCIKSDRNLGLTVEFKYEVKEFGLYYNYRSDMGIVLTLDESEFKLYFEVVK